MGSRPRGLQVLLSKEHKMQSSSQDFHASRIPPTEKTQNGSPLYQVSPQNCRKTRESASSENWAEGRARAGSHSKDEQE